jgi:hypothetical protein
MSIKLQFFIEGMEEYDHTLDFSDIKSPIINYNEEIIHENQLLYITFMLSYIQILFDPNIWKLFSIFNMYDTTYYGKNEIEKYNSHMKDIYDYIDKEDIYIPDKYLNYEVWKKICIILSLYGTYIFNEPIHCELNRMVDLSSLGFITYMNPLFNGLIMDPNGFNAYFKPYKDHLVSTIYVSNIHNGKLYTSDSMKFMKAVIDLYDYLVKFKEIKINKKLYKIYGLNNMLIDKLIKGKKNYVDCVIYT